MGTHSTYRRLFESIRILSLTVYLVLSLFKCSNMVCMCVCLCEYVSVSLVLSELTDRNDIKNRDTH